jgi:uncharacterized caspase-like protein
MDRAGRTARRTAAIWTALLAAIALALLGAPRAQAEGRVALVIGNSAYQNLPQLNNPKNDAADVSQSFTRLGFKVTTVQDASFEQLRLALLEFGRAAADADMAVLFYAGHGIEVAGENWLLPVDTNLKSDMDVNTEAITLRRAMLSVSNAKLLGLVILDACRNNAFANVRRTDATRAAERGLAPIDPAENVLVAYAARDGTTARDGAGRNSPFTAALLRHLETPGLELEFLFRNVRDDVWAATQGEQQPFLYGSLSKDEVYFKEPEVATATDASQTADARPVAPAPEDTVDAGELTWSFVRSTSDVDTLRRFTEQFPGSARAGDAKLRIAALETSGQKSDAAPAGGGLYSLASAESVQLDAEDLKAARPFRRNTAATEAAWKVLKDSKDTTIVRRFVDHFPSGRRRIAVESRPVFFASRIASATPVDPNAAPVLITRDVLLRAAADADVLKCFQTDDIGAAECQRALERYPLISQFTYDYRFRLTLCRALVDACGGRLDFLQSGYGLQAHALFNPANMDPAKLGGAPGVVIAPSGPVTSPGVTPMSSPDILFRPGPTTRPVNSTHTPHITSPHPISGTRPLGWKWGTKIFTGTGSKNFGARTVRIGTHHFKTVPKFNVTTIKTGNVNVRTPHIRTVNVNTTIKVTSTTVRVPHVRVPTVKVPTVKVPTVRVPTLTVRIPR